jgi:hypothetical protein
MPSKCCDCGRRSRNEYEWPTCKDCRDIFCPDCYAAETYREDEGREWCICYVCQEIRDTEGDIQEDDDENEDLLEIRASVSVIDVDFDD